ncbi:uncharacterized protein LOC134233885 [Saccostrea cucullata]|uniref:uncharacterized protein LOC134233885 n=1 Tax=Saccostrea cuccullata TaxID=36930 RepID=UPI002ED3BE54
MGLASAPRIFTKLLKPVFSTLRKRGHANIAYIDDSLLVSKTESECRKNVRETAELLDSLGFTINVEKSVFTPSRDIQFLGFIINSELMTVSLTPDRATSIRQKCEEILKLHRITIREFAQLFGKLVSSEPGVRYAPLYYKSLEIVKDKELKTNAGNFDAKFLISGEIRKTITWWINNVERFPRFINIDKPVLVIKTDSSLAGWGIFNENNGDCYQGEWLDEDKEKHINFLELKVGLIALSKFCNDLQEGHVKLYMDNTVAVTYISKMGGKIESLNDLTISIWDFCMARNIWLSASHIAGVENIEADYLSRHKNDDLEWMLDRNIFSQIENSFGKCDIDLFASKHNFQFMPYVSYSPDQHAKAIDAFSMDWSDLMCYIFCPFSLMGSVLQKITTDRAEAIVIAPIWPTQHWFPRLLQGQLSVAGHSKSSDDAEQTREVPPTEKNETGRIPCIGESFKNRGLSDDTQKILLSSWRESTKKQYRAYFEKWLSFCNSRQINVFEANVNNVLSFLTELFQSGSGYSCLNTARSALSSFLQLENCVNIGSHPLIRRFMRGVFVLRPALPRYNVTWDVNIVLKYLKSLSPLSSLSLLQLSRKLVMLLALLSGKGDKPFI